MSTRKTPSPNFLNLRHDVLVCLFLIIATLAVYWQVRNFAFVDYDDDLYVFKNRYVQYGLSLENTKWSFETTHAGNWHPLTWLSHMLDCELYGLSPGGHHLTSVFFHIVNTLLLFSVFRKMTGAFFGSAFVAALFALHPLHVESVAWVAERKDVLSTFFWMLTIWAYLYYVEHPGIHRYLAVTVFFILGLMSKPMLVTLPFVLLLLDYWPLGRMQFGQSARKSNSGNMPLVLEKIPLVVLAALSSIITFYAQHRGGAVAPLNVFPPMLRIANTLVSYVGYIGKMFWPVRLAVFYPHAGLFRAWQVAGAFVLLASISFLVIRAARGRPYLAVGWLWYIGTLVPVIGLVQIGSQAMADRYTYIPLIGLFILMVWGVSELIAGWRYRKAGIAAISSVILSVFMAITWIQIGYWKNSITLFEHALDVAPNNYVAHNGLAVALAKAGRPSEAIRHYSEAVQINPYFVEARNNLGVLLSTQGRITEAIRQYSEALRINPRYVKAHNNLGKALIGQGRIEQGIAEFRKALRISPDYDKAHYNLAVALTRIGSTQEAIHHYTWALRLNPYYVEAHNNLGVALFREGRMDEAMVHFRSALRLRPGFVSAQQNLKKVLAAEAKINEAFMRVQEKLRHNPEDALLHFKLGELYQRKGKVGEAEAEYQKSLSIQPTLLPALNRLGVMYSNDGEYGKAISVFEQIVEVQPDSPGAYYNIACLYARQDKVGEAVDWLKKAVQKGYKNWYLIKNDKDLANIRGTTYYRELVRGR